MASENDHIMIDPAVYDQLVTANLRRTVELLRGLAAALPIDYQPELQERLGIYQGFVMSPKFMRADGHHPEGHHPWAQTLKGWILTDWANQARLIKDRIEMGLTGR